MKKSWIAAGAAVLMLSTAACGSGSDNGDKSDSGNDGAKKEDVTLTWAGTGGEGQKREKQAFQDPFTKETGIKVEDVTYASLAAQLTTMVDSGKTVWDVVHTASQIVGKYCGTLLEKVDFSDLPDVFPEGTTTDCSVPAGKYGFVFAYDTTAYKGTVPTKIEDFFDTKKFPGKRIVRANNPRGYLEAALVADGVAPADLYPLDIDRALKKLGTIKKDLVFVPTITAIQQKMVNGQGTMTITLSGTLGHMFEAGAKVAPVWDTTFWDFDAFVVPKGSPHKKEAVEAIKFLLQPDRLLEYAKLGGLTPVRTDVDQNAVEYTKGGKEFNPFAGSDRGELVLFDAAWWSANLEKASAAWVKWQSS